MRSFRNLVGAIAISVALGGCTAASPAASHQAFRLDKSCAGAACTVISSDLKLIPPGTVIDYTQVGDGSAKLATTTMAVANGSATGVCDFNFNNDPLNAKCTFTKGTGVLAGFHLQADVTLTGDQKINGVWHWVGTYWFGE